MKKILISFLPEVFPALLTGEKRFEYRSRLPEGEIEAYIYLSSPVKMITGRMRLGERLLIRDLLDNANDEIRCKLEKHMGEGSVYCSPILSLSLFDQPISLDEARKLDADFCAPQGFVYLERYPALCVKLEEANLSFYEINPTCSREGLGLFSSEIKRLYPRRIEMPPYLNCFKDFGKSLTTPTAIGVKRSS